MWAADSLTLGDFVQRKYELLPVWLNNSVKHLHNQFTFKVLLHKENTYFTDF